MTLRNDRSSGDEHPAAGHRSAPRRWRWLALAVAVLAGCAVLPAQAGAQATRTWVSGVGDDVNPCSRTAPCKTLAGSIAKTAAGGEINAIDGGGFGAVAITKAITIDLSNVPGGILNAGQNGIVVNAGATDDVVLRGLRIDGGSTGAGACTYNGLNGIRLLKAGSLRVEDTRISHQRQAGIVVAPTVGTTKMVLDDVTIGESCEAGLDVAPGAGAAVSGIVRDTTITNAATGIHVGAGAHVSLTRSSIFGNGTGLAVDPGGVLDSYGDNQITGNGSDGSPTNVLGGPAPVVVPVPGPTTVVTVPVPVPGPPGPTAPATAPTGTTPEAQRCTVPSVVGLKPAAARKKLTAAHCKLGRQSTRKTSKRKRVGRIVRQKVKAGTRLADGASVAVTVGKRAKGTKRAKR